jgi:multicomponent Na+:H+ antiporter subunit E
VGLAFILAIFWLINSGHFQGFLLGLGLLSVAGVVVIVRHMELADQEYTPVNLSIRLLFYFPWLGREVIRSNIDVVRKIWQPTIDISPGVITVRASQKSDMGKVIYANSITMTPGTVTLDVQDDVFEVHALTREMAEGLQQGEMDRQVARVEN